MSTLLHHCKVKNILSKNITSQRCSVCVNTHTYTHLKTRLRKHTLQKGDKNQEVKKKQKSKQCIMSHLVQVKLKSQISVGQSKKTEIVNNSNLAICKEEKCF
jgi:hypothetical protein